MKVSIITVCKNSKTTIERTIKSVISQDYTDIEYIIIDGSSTDGTVDIIKKYENYIDYWSSEPDKSVYDAMNKGIMKASGEAIGILNSDDWYEPNAVSISVRKMLEDSADITYGNMEMIHSDGYKKNWRPLAETAPWEHMPWSHPTVFVRKCLYEKCGLFDTSYRIAADYKWLFLRWAEGKKFSYIDSLITHFSMGGISNTQVKETKEEDIRVRREMLNEVNPNSELFELLSENLEVSYGDEALTANPDVLVKSLEKMGICDGVQINLIGTGKVGGYLLDVLDELEKIGLLADNDVNKQGSVLGKKHHVVQPVEQVKMVGGYTIVSVLSPKLSQELEKQLTNLGCTYVTLKDFKRGLGKAFIQVKDEGKFHCD